LEDRFKLVLQRETKVLPVYVLTAAAGGPTLHPAKDPGSKAPVEDRLEKVSGSLHLDKATMKEFCKALSRQMDRVVVNETEISGAFQFDLNFESGRDRSGVAIFSAVQKQLGLKLRPGNRPIETLTVKSAQRTK